jgi:hypothetical protein
MRALQTLAVPSQTLPCLLADFAQGSWICPLPDLPRPLPVVLGQAIDITEYPIWGRDLHYTELRSKLAARMQAEKDISLPGAWVQQSTPANCISTGSQSQRMASGGTACREGSFKAVMLGYGIPKNGSRLRQIRYIV